MPPSAFFQSCGGREPIRFAVDGVAEPLAFTTPVILVGSEPRCDIVLPSGNPGKATAFFLYDGRLFSLPLDGISTSSAAWVKAGDKFEFAGMVLQPLNPEQPECHLEPFDPLAPDEEHETELHFEPARAFRGKKAPRRLAVLPRLTLIGRTEPARFKINYDGIETIHAAVLRTHGGPWIVDLTLRNGTLVNDGPISAARLRNGDRVHIGSVELIAHVANVERAVVAAPPALDATVGPILQHVAQFQQQTFDQFREMLGSVTDMFGSVLNEHRQFVREELARLERGITTSAAPQLAAAPPVPPPAPIPVDYRPPETVTPILTTEPGMSAAPPNVAIHSWVSEQLGTLEKTQKSRWERLIQRFLKN